MTTETATPPAPAKGGGCRKVAILAGLFFAFTGVYFVWSLNAPAMAANSFKEGVRPGMTLTDVVLASFAAPRHMVMVESEEGSPQVGIGSYSVNIAGETAETPEKVRALLERRAPELKVKSIRVMFLSAVPVRSTILVRFGEDGKVSAVEGPFNRAS